MSVRVRSTEWCGNSSLAPHHPPQISEPVPRLALSTFALHPPPITLNSAYSNVQSILSTRLCVLTFARKKRKRSWLLTISKKTTFTISPEVAWIVQMLLLWAYIDVLPQSVSQFSFIHAIFNVAHTMHYALVLLVREVLNCSKSLYARPFTCRFLSPTLSGNNWVISSRIYDKY